MLPLADLLTRARPSYDLTHIPLPEVRIMTMQSLIATLSVFGALVML